MQKKLLRGFTLIELIITITILSILAVALLAALDPIEQFNRARDTGIRNTALELHNAIQRAYAVTSSWPDALCTTDTVTGGCTGGARALNGETDISPLVQQLVTLGELKANFNESARGRYPNIFIRVEGGGSTNIYTCFRPRSKGFIRDENNVWTDATPPQNNCDNTAANNTCQYCVQ